MFFIFTYQMVGIMNDTKTTILQKSLELFLQKSYKEVTLTEIVTEVGVTKGAFYHYYNSKEEIFEESVRYLYSHFMITDFSTFPRASLKAFYKAYLMRLKENSGLSENKDYNILLFIVEARRRVASYFEIHAAQRKKEQTAWKAIVDQAKQNKEINTTIPSRQIASMFLNLSDGVALNNIALDNQDNALEEIMTDWDNLYKLLGGI